MCSNAPDYELQDTLELFNSLLNSGDLQNLVQATALKYDIRVILDDDFSQKNFDSFQKSVERLNYLINSSNSVKVDLLKLYATTESYLSKDLVVCSLNLHPKTDLGEVFIRAFTPKELYTRFKDFQIFSTTHMLVLPEWLSFKLLNDKLECVVVNKKFQTHVVKPESKILVSYLASIWNPYEPLDLYNDFLLSYRTAQKIENLS